MKNFILLSLIKKEKSSNFIKNIYSLEFFIILENIFAIISIKI
jgi:hypothetical protein